MHSRISDLIGRIPIKAGEDGIYSVSQPLNSGQREEREHREQVAAQYYDDYLGTIAKSHSIPVMDHEVDRFLSSLPPHSLVLDVGGCWGWHWRRISESRPDVGVVIVDFVRANLIHARNVLGSLTENQIMLMHADATDLPFPAPSSEFEGFDGFWTVQAFQHIPDFIGACREARRVLRVGGSFVNYSLHITPLYRLIHKLLGKKFHVKGMVNGGFYLTRASDFQRDQISDLFGSPVVERYTECLFHPDLLLPMAGKNGSLLGKLDIRLGDFPSIGRWIARQRSYHVIKGN